MEHISTDEKLELKEVQDVEKVARDSKALFNLYNSEGGLLLLKGQPISPKLSKIKIFASKKDLPDEIKNLSDLVYKEKDESIECSADFLLNAFGQKNYELSKQMMDFGSEIFNPELSVDKRIKKSIELINETIKEDLKSINSCIYFLRDKDSYTFAHSLSVYTLTLLALSGFKKDQNKDIFWETFKEKLLKVNFTNTSFIHYGVASFLHDFGKTLIPPEIINKPGKLTDKEFHIIKLHPSLGVKALTKQGINEAKILQIVGNHHPAYAVYKDQLENPLVTICNIIDVYDALRSKRPYKDPMDWTKTKSILLEEKKKNNWNYYIYDSLVNFILDDIEKYRSSMNQAEI